MPSASHYKRQIWEIIGVKPNWRGKILREFTWNDYPTAKNLLSRIRLIQKRLRLLKKEVNFESKAIRSKYRGQISRTQAGLGSTLLLGKGNAKSLAAAKKRDIRAKQNSEIAPYEGVKGIIDTLLLETDVTKHHLVSWMEFNKQSSKA